MYFSKCDFENRLREEVIGYIRGFECISSFQFRIGVHNLIDWVNRDGELIVLMLLIRLNTC